MGNEQDELQIHVQSQGFDLVVIMETWWDSSHDCSVVMQGFSLLGRHRQGRHGDGVALFARQHLECIRLLGWMMSKSRAYGYIKLIIFSL